MLFDNSQRFIIYICKAFGEGKISYQDSEELGAIYMAELVEKAGFEELDIKLPGFREVEKHAIHMMKTRLIELHPELAEEVDRIIDGKSGRS